MTDEITVFSASAHPEFAERMCELLGVELSPTRITRFSNDCLRVQLGANCRRKDVYIVQPLVPPVQEHLVELLLMLDAARGASANHITAVIPHFAYARSDKKDDSRISIGARLVADMLHAAGATRVITMTLHSEQVHGFFSVPVDHLTAIRELASAFRDKDLSDTVVVSPDFGYAKVASEFARLLDLPVAAGSKRRLGDDTVVIDRIVGDVEGKRVIIIDDEIATAGSMIELIGKLREEGVREISIATTHGLFTGKAVARLDAEPDIGRIVSTDTVPLTGGAYSATPGGVFGGAAVRRGGTPPQPRRIGQLAVLRRSRVRLRGRLRTSGSPPGSPPASPMWSPPGCRRRSGPGRRCGSRRCCRR